MPFDPTTLAGLVALYECDSGTYQDTALTTPATADGAVVKGWKDRTSNHNDAIEGTANPVIQMVGGVPTIKFAGAQKLARTLSATIAAGTSYTAHCLCSSVMTNGTNCVLSVGTPGAAILLAPTWTTGGIIGLNSASTGPDGCEDSRAHLISVAYTATASKYWLDGVPIYSATAGYTIPAVGDLHLGEYPGVGTKSNVLMLAFASAVHSDADAANLYAYYRSRYSAAWPLPTNTLIWDCNSLGTGLYVGASAQTVPYLATVNTALGSPAWINLSRGGYTTTQLIADLPARLGSPGLASQKLNRACLVLWDGRNDEVVNGLTPRQAADNYRTYCQLARSLGVARVAVMTMLPTDHNSAGTADTAWNAANRDPFNAFVMAEWPSYADAVIPVHLDPTIGQSGQNTNTTNYQTDGVHLKLPGATIVAGWARGVVDSLMGGTASFLPSVGSRFIR